MLLFSLLQMMTQTRSLPPLPLLRLKQSCLFPGLMQCFLVCFAFLPSLQSVCQLAARTILHFRHIINSSVCNRPRALLAFLLVCVLSCSLDHFSRPIYFLFLTMFFINSFENFIYFAQIHFLNSSQILTSPPTIFQFIHSYFLPPLLSLVLPCSASLHLLSRSLPPFLLLPFLFLLKKHMKAICVG